MGRLRPGAALRRRWAVGWTSHEVGSWACPVGRWNPHHDAGATGVSVADGEGSLECAADADPDDRRNGRGGDSRQRVRLAAVCSVVAFLASSSGVGLSSFLVAVWLPSGLRSASDKNHAAYGIGLRVTRHPRMGAVEELKVPLGELAGLGPHRDRDLSRRTVLVRPAKQDHGHPLHRQTPRKKHGRAFQKLIANDAGFFAFTLRSVEERS